MRNLALLIAPLLLAGAAPAVPPAPKVALQTSLGTIVVQLDGKHAPVTTANFLHYVEAHRLDGTSFYRAARTKGMPNRGLIQGGIRHDMRRAFFSIDHEPTSKTGIRHTDGTISMARNAPGTAMGDFFITVGAMPSMDAHGQDPGFAAFGHVVKGMDVVKKILAAPTWPDRGSGAMKGQMIEKPVTIVSARRVG